MKTIIRQQAASDDAAGAVQCAALKNRLVLLAWLNKQFGYKSNHSLLTDLDKNVAEGHDGEGRSYVCLHLLARENLRVPPDDLIRYDDNIRNHLRATNARRLKPVTLRRFQYVAALYTDFFLDWYFHRRGEMVRQLNDFVMKRNMGASLSGLDKTRFSKDDLGKLAFWMATDSGKTLVMHLNYRQFLHYNERPLDNILLVTPSEDLSERHMEEMEESNIACRRFDLNASGLAMGDKNAVWIIEIAKLEEPKRSGGASIPVEAFEGNNLIFVDEGRMGAGGEAWRSYRDALGKTGFTFEYSAAFGQALTAAKNDRLTEEYGKAMAFDYSYRHFHSDGYGKDFRILDIMEDAVEADNGSRMLLLGGLLSFYEQLLVFEVEALTLKPYHLERPLWAFVGGTANAVYSRCGRKHSDVLTVARFLHSVLENRNGWAAAGIEKLLSEDTGLLAPDGCDAFEGRFQHLRACGMSPKRMYRDILARVFRTPSSGGLRLSTIRSGAGEIGLKADGGADYFGLIHIVDAGAFRNLVEQDGSGIVLEEDVAAGSLFDRIGAPDTTIDMLIGANRFMEGRSSRRVSSMGLLNIGRRDGPKVIQLFECGTRLLGWKSGLKRSSALDGAHPNCVKVLETLDIFAVRADCMAQFRCCLEKEGVEPDGVVELPLPIQPNDRFLDRGLMMLHVPKNRNFLEEVDLLLEPDEKVRVQVDLSPKARGLAGKDVGMNDAAMQRGGSVSIPDASLDLVDWERVYLDLLAYKESKEYANLAILPDAARRIIAFREPHRLYSLIADGSVTKPKSFEDAIRLQETVTALLSKYMDRFHRSRWEAWDSAHMVYKPIDRHDPVFHDYTLRAPRRETELIRSIRNFINRGDAIYKRNLRDLPSIHFDRHLYQPLLVKGRDDIVKSVPPGLAGGECRFVEDLRAWCRKDMDGEPAGKHIYLLRNLGWGKGTGFFEARGFHPGFILWIQNGGAQRIVFVEPHSMLFHAEPHEHNPKATLHEKLPALSRDIEARTGVSGITLDSYIISATSYEVLRLRYDDGSWSRKRFTDAHILFPEDDDYIQKILTRPQGDARHSYLSSSGGVLSSPSSSGGGS